MKTKLIQSFIFCVFLLSFSSVSFGQGQIRDVDIRSLSATKLVGTIPDIALPANIAKYNATSNTFLNSLVAPLLDKGGFQFNVVAFGANGTDGIADDSAFTLASSSATAFGGAMQIPVGSFKISSNITIPSNVQLNFSPASILSVDSTKTVTIKGAITAGLYQIFSGAGTVSIANNVKIPQVYPQWWGAKAGRYVSDASIAALGNTLTSSQAAFTSGDIGKTIFVSGAGVGGALLATSISGVLSSTQATLTTAASTTVMVGNSSWQSDDTAAIQKAIDAVCESGGTVFFSTPGRYGISSTIFVKSRYPVNLISNGMHLSDGGSPDGNFGSYFAPLNNIAGAMFEYTNPSGATVAEVGSGDIKGLAFFDDSNRFDSILENRRVYTIYSAIKLSNWFKSTLTNCSFEYLRGRAIHTENCYLSTISDNVIRYCGDTSRPAIELDSRDSTHFTESLKFEGNKIEVNFLAPYVQTGQYTKHCRIINNEMEAETTIANSNQTFLDTATQTTQGLQIIGNDFKRNNAIAVKLGHQNIFTANFFESQQTLMSLDVEGNGNLINANWFYNNSTLPTVGANPTVLLRGVNNRFVNNNLAYSGKIKTDNINNVISDNMITDSRATDNVILSDFLYTDGVSSTFTQVTGNTLVWTQAGVSGTAGVGTLVGIQINSGSIVSNNKTRTYAIPIRISTSTCIVSGNWSTGATIAIDFGGGNTPRNNTIFGNVPFKTEANGIATIPNGSTTVTVAHGLSYTPAVDDITIWPAADIGTVTKWYVSGLSSTNIVFTVSPAASNATCSFGWVAKIQ